MGKLRFPDRDTNRPTTVGDKPTVVVAYALPDRQFMAEVVLSPGLTVRGAIEGSGLLTRFPEIDPGSAEVGIHGRITDLDAALKPHDRVEIYRPLNLDPKEQRRLRAKAAKSR
jgi:uncharacterized protein